MRAPAAVCQWRTTTSRVTYHHAMRYYFFCPRLSARTLQYSIFLRLEWLYRPNEHEPHSEDGFTSDTHVRTLDNYEISPFSLADDSVIAATANENGTITTFSYAVKRRSGFDRRRCDSLRRRLHRLRPWRVSLVSLVSPSSSERLRCGTIRFRRPT